MAQPKVIACGHKYFSAKTGNSFPAFLVQFSSLREPFDDYSSSSKNYGSDGDYGKMCCFWRSKHDFLLLNRAMQKFDKSFSRNSNKLPYKQTQDLPKKAFEKLCNQAIQCGPWISLLDVTNESTTTMNELNEIIESYMIENSFDKRMKKSLHMVDSYLGNIYDVCMMSNGSVNDNACVGVTEEDAAFKGVVDAWTLFCREKDTDGLIIPHRGDTSSCSNSNEFDECEDRVITNAARLGQYFASDENVKDVVDTTLQLMNSLELSSEEIVFIEPSCGDGRIILGLLSNASFTTRNASIAGYDIDQSAIERSQQNLKSVKSDKSVVLRCSDFLTLTQQDMLHDLNLTKETSDVVTVVLGGPPYTPKDLPEKFILHCIKVLHAEMIFFLLPKRCGKDGARVQEILNSSDEYVERWQFVNKELVNSTFDFEGRSVTQPSIMQYWYKK